MEAPERAEAVETPAPLTPPSYEEVARRAYRFYVERGGQPGDPFQDWVRAEYELWEERRASAGA